MEVEFKMPKFGDMADGTVVDWLKAEGDSVQEGEVIVEIELAKAEVEVEAPVSGVLRRIVVGIDETVDVGSVLAVIDTGSTPPVTAS